MWFLMATESWNSQEVFELMLSLVNSRTPSRNVRQRPLAPDKERDVRARYEAFKHPLAELVRNLDAEALAGAFRINTRRLKRLLRNDLSSVCGELVATEGAELVYCMRESGFMLYTHVDSGGWARQFEYWHTVIPGTAVTRGRPRDALLGQVSVASWLGVSGTSSVWNYVRTESELEGMVTFVRDMCVEFLGAFRTFLIDLPE